MRHPRRSKTLPLRKQRLMIRGDSRPTFLSYDSDTKVMHIRVNESHLAPWTPARQRSGKWIEIRRITGLTNSD